MQLAQAQLEGYFRSKNAEYLHQYRVGLRKVQSLVSRRLETASPLQKQLKKLIRQTNAQRDIDVLWLALKGKLGQQLKHCLAKTQWQHLKEKINQFRKCQRNQLMTKLQSNAQVQMRQHIQQLLNQAECRAVQTQTKHHQRDLHSLDDMQHQLVCAVQQLKANSSDAAFHQIRLLVKALRYRLIASECAKADVQMLKQLQTTLGYTQDLAVQQLLLRKLMKKLGVSQGKRRQVVKMLDKVLSKSRTYSRKQLQHYCQHRQAV